MIADFFLAVFVVCMVWLALLLVAFFAGVYASAWWSLFLLGWNQ